MPRGVELTWLDGDRAVDPADVGQRAYALARLRTAGLPVLRGMVLGRKAFELAASEPGRGSGGLTQLPREIVEATLLGLRQIGGPWAVRRSRLPGGTRDTPVQHETYLHVLDATDVLEAVRRIWELSLSMGERVAVLLQRFVTPEVSARVRDQGEVALVESSYGVGDLLADGLVVSDKHLVERATGKLRSRTMGRKSQMTIPSSDGGLVRVPVPVASARELALTDELAIEIARVWWRAEAAAGRLSTLSLAVSGTKLTITSVDPAGDVSQDELMLG